MSKLDGTRRQRKCFSHYESKINGRKSPKYDCVESFTILFWCGLTQLMVMLVTIKEVKVVICLVKSLLRSGPGLCCDNLAR